MSLSNKKAREIAFLILYSQELNAREEGLESLVRTQLEVSRLHYKEAENRVIKIEEYLPTIDLIIDRICTQFDFKRIQKVEKAILRLGAYEILYDSDLDPKVAITEAIRLAAKFSTPQAAQFVNAILDTLYKESIGKKMGDVPNREDTQFFDKAENG